MCTVFYEVDWSSEVNQYYKQLTNDTRSVRRSTKHTMYFYIVEVVFWSSPIIAKSKISSRLTQSLSNSCLVSWLVTTFIQS